MNRNVVPLPGVDPHTEGSACVAPDELRRKLGHTAWHVWSILCAIRDHHGEVFPSLQRIATMRGYVRTHPRNVRKALSKLKCAGLVRDVGWQYRTFDRGSSTLKRRVFVRYVFGALVLKKRRIRTWTDAQQGPQDEIVVPSTTARWLKTASMWGGLRPNAGRWSEAMIAMAASDEESSGSRAQRIKRVGVVVPSKDQSIVEGSPVVLTNNRPAEGGTGFSFAESQLGTIIGNPAAHGAAMPGLDEPLEGVPPYPDFTVVMPARIPPPPLLDSDASDADNALQMACAYQGALEVELKLRSRRPSDVTRSKHFKTLVAGAAKLIEHEIPPTSWALWSCGVWRDYVAAKGRPTMSWMFSPKRIDERRGWFRRESHAYAGGRVVFGKKHRELLHRYERMRIELHKSATTQDEVREVVARFFPPGATYEHMVAAARTEADQRRRRFQERLARGEFLWSA